MKELRILAEPPLSSEEFREALLGAQEHESSVTHKGRSKSHLLGTIARSVTAMIRAKAETFAPYVQHAEFLPRILDCARHIAKKNSTGCSNLTLNKLYDFIRNRCDDAAIRVLVDQVIVATDPRWSELSTIEKEMAVTFLKFYNDKVEEDCRFIKDFLGSS